MSLSKEAIFLFTRSSTTFVGHSQKRISRLAVSFSRYQVQFSDMALKMVGLESRHYIDFMFLILVNSMRIDVTSHVRPTGRRLVIAKRLRNNNMRKLFNQILSYLLCV